jgi:hypothetical protein
MVHQDGEGFKALCLAFAVAWCTVGVMVWRVKYENAPFDNYFGKYGVTRGRVGFWTFSQ